MKAFEQINRGFNNTFQPERLSIGIVIPIENYINSSVPEMFSHLKRAQLAEELGFMALWVRDVPMHVPSFGDAGQLFDPFTYLGYLAGQTHKIALGVASIALPLRHPVHVVKSATTIDQLSGGRVILGIASGDRYQEYPAMNASYENRGQSFRHSYEYIRKAQENFPILKENEFGEMNGTIDVLPKAYGTKIPMLITGHSQQSISWIAENGDGWMYYPRDHSIQKSKIDEWRSLVATKQKISKPFMQSLYIDLNEDDDFKPQGIHLGIRTGINYLLEYLNELQNIGVNHVAINLRLNNANMEKTLERFGKYILPHYS